MKKIILSILGILALQFSLQAQTIHTIAGNALKGPAVHLAQTYQPAGITIDNAGNIYVCEAGNHRVTKWAPNATEGVVVAGVSGQWGSSFDKFNNPQSIAIDDTGNLYILDAGNFRIQKWAPNATSGVTVAGGNDGGNNLNQLGNATAIFLDQSSNNIYISDRSNHRVLKWEIGDTAGVVVAGGHGQGSAANQLYNPRGIWVDSQENIYIADYYNNRIQKWAKNDTTGTTVAGGHGLGNSPKQFRNPCDVVVRPNGDMIIADRSNNRIQLWQANDTIGSSLIYNIISGLDFIEGLNNPEYLFIDNSGNLYVSENYAFRVRKWQISSLPSSTSGEIVAGGNWIGNRNDLLNYPEMPLVDDDGNLYIADHYNSRIMKWEKGATTGTIVFGERGRGFGIHQLYNPSKIKFNKNKDGLYILDRQRLLEWKFGDSTGTVIVNKNIALSQGYSGYKFEMTAFDIDSSGNFYFVDNNNHRVLKASNNINSVSVVAGGNGAGADSNQLDAPQDVHVDRQGNVYVVEYNNSRVSKWAPSAGYGVVVAAGNGHGNAANQINRPTQFFVDDSLNIYIADRQNARVQKWEANATSGITVVGGNGQGANMNQIGYGAQVTVDKHGVIYVSDQSNHRVQRWIWSPTGYDTVAACDSFTWIDGKNYYADNSTSSHMLPNASASGEDSVVFLNLTVNPSPTVNITKSGDTLKATPGLSAYQWFLNGNSIAGATSAMYIPTVSGKYTCEGTNEFDCEALSNEIDYEKTDIGSLEKDNIKIYPNPVKDRLNIQLSDNENHLLGIYNMMGQKVYHQSVAKANSHVTIATGHLPAGVYTLRVQSDNKIGVKQFVVQH